jgi:hypothetical protein
VLPPALESFVPTTGRFTENCRNRKLNPAMTQSVSESIRSFLYGYFN